MAELFRAPRHNRGGKSLFHTPHPQQVSLCVQFRLIPFRSPLLWKSQLVSLPPLTKMFQFRGLPLLTERWPKPSGSPIQESSDLRLHASPRGLSQLATPFIGIQAKPSNRQRSYQHCPGSHNWSRKSMHGIIEAQFHPTETASHHHPQFL